MSDASKVLGALGIWIAACVLFVLLAVQTAGTLPGEREISGLFANWTFAMSSLKA